MTNRKRCLVRGRNIALVLVAWVGGGWLAACGGTTKTPLPVDAAPPRDTAVDRAPAPVVDAPAPEPDAAPLTDAAPVPDAPPDAPLPVAAGGTVPDPWKAYLVGGPEGGGSASFASNAFSVAGSGRDIYDILGFTFVVQPFTGDGEIVAQVSGMAGTAVSPAAKAGVMLMTQDGLVNASATWAGTFVTPGAGAAGQWRAEEAGVAATAGAGVETVPGWVKLAKVGQFVTFAYSPDGAVWIPFGRQPISRFTEPLYIGLAVSGRTEAGMDLVTATFTNVTVTRYEGAQPDAGGTDAGATDGGGVAGTDGPLPGGPVPNAWSVNDIGTPLPGSATFDDGTYRLAGGGRDIWARADNGVFVYQRLTGDAEITAHIPGVEPTNQHAKAGLMIRASLLADDINTMWLVKPINPPNDAVPIGLSFQWRPTKAANSTARDQRFLFAPQKLRLARKGGNVEASILLSNNQWFLVGRQALALPQDIYVGMAVTAHDVNRVATGLFDSVTITGTPAGPLPDGGADAPFNDAAIPDAAPDVPAAEAGDGP